MRDFDQQLEQEMPGLRRYALALTGDPDRADDLVQDCLERALRKSHLWVRRNRLGGWLRTILHNLHVNQARRTAARPVHLPLEPHAGGHGTAPTQGPALNLSQLLESLQRLPESQRQILLLVGMEQMSYREVATQLHLPIGTVMSRLSRARERLRALTGEVKDSHLRRVK